VASKSRKIGNLTRKVIANYSSTTVREFKNRTLGSSFAENYDGMERNPKLLQADLQKINFARKQILNLVEAAYGHTPQWERVRSRILAILGRNGLEGSLIGMEAENGTDEKNGIKYHD